MYVWDWQLFDVRVEMKYEIECPAVTSQVEVPL